MLACEQLNRRHTKLCGFLNRIIHALATTHHQGNAHSKWQISIDRIKIVDGNERLFFSDIR